MGKRAILFILALLSLAHSAPAADVMNWQDALAYAENLSLGGLTTGDCLIITS